MENDSPVILPEMGSRNASFKQHSVGGPTSYLIPTILTNSCSYLHEYQGIISFNKNNFLICKSPDSYLNN